jgi:UDP-4-amino-4,6-dideoxy-N-acetyl-beta-L-altrosamine transaminase
VPAGFLPYGRQSIDEGDIAAVVEALRSDFLTTGPRVEAFEAAFAAAVGAQHAVACSNGTTALHMAMMALGLAEGDRCVVPSITFVATANAVRFQGAEVTFCDVDPKTGLMTPETLERALTAGGGKACAVLPVHLAGRMPDLAGLNALAAKAGACLVEDACHALGSTGSSGRAGDCAHSEMACFSFHPVKTIATGEGGMVTTNEPYLAEALRLARNHGITRDPDRFAHAERAGEPWYYEQEVLGWNYRLPDVLCALGLSQLGKLEAFVERRLALARRYDALLQPLSPLVRTLPTEGRPGLHLYVVLIDFAAAGVERAKLMESLRTQGVGSQVHYIPVHRQPYYVERYGSIDLPGADAWYDRCLSLPLFPAMADDDPERVVEALSKALGR